MSHWQQEVATTVVSLLTHAGKGKMPVTPQQWRDAAENLCINFHVVKTHDPEGGVVIENTIVVKDSAKHSDIQRRSAHEFAEYLLASEWESPYNFQSADSDSDRHTIARMVEQQSIRLMRRERKIILKRRQSLEQQLQCIQEQIARENERLQQFDAELD